MHAQSKNSPNGPLTSFEELYSLGNKWTPPQAALHTAMNLEIRLRTQTVITIYEGVCALFQQTKNDGGKKVRSLTCLISSQLWFSATAEIDDLEASILNRKGKEQIILASQPRLVPKKQLSSCRMCRCLRLTSESQQSLYEQQ